ncbi:MAG TPA: ribokinase [Terracidiphilus sp.]|nr:ribokinase [Terracidiphilus sp.]
MTKPIVVVGSINMDLVARTHTIPRPGETVIGTGFETTPGGKGANQAVAVARLGYPVKMVGMVGEDVFGQALLKNLADNDVGVWAVDRVEGPSGVAPILLAESGENSIVVVPGANGKVDCDYIDKNAELIRGAGMVLLQLEIPIPTNARVMEICAEAGVPVMLDPAPAAPLHGAAFWKAAWMTPNETEAALYLGGAMEPEAAAKEFLSRGVQGVVLKRGAEGAYVAAPVPKEGPGAPIPSQVSKSRPGAPDSSQVPTKGPEWVPAFKVEPVDTVGAGDCFNGAFAVALMEGRDPWEAARFASAAAAISVTRRGAQASMPTRAEVEDFLARQENGRSG